MVVRGREFEDIYDLVAVKFLVDTVPDCYAVLDLPNTYKMILQTYGKLKVI